MPNSPAGILRSWRGWNEVSLLGCETQFHLLIESKLRLAEHLEPHLLAVGQGNVEQGRIPEEFAVAQPAPEAVPFHSLSRPRS